MKTVKSSRVAKVVFSLREAAPENTKKVGEKRHFPLDIKLVTFGTNSHIIKKFSAQLPISTYYSPSITLSPLLHLGSGNSHLNEYTQFCAKSKSASNCTTLSVTLKIFSYNFFEYIYFFYLLGTIPASLTIAELLPLVAPFSASSSKMWRLSELKLQ